jgi:deazaflavin-dependent oxidoreductase (nitroreductase family)
LVRKWLPASRFGTKKVARQAEVEEAPEVRTVTYREANPIQRFMRWSAATGPISWFYRRVLHHVDRAVYRLTRGRHTLSSFVSGLPVVMLTTTGAKTGQQRTSPVLAVPDGVNLVVIASNWGQGHHPAWYHNLCADPAVTITVGGVSRPARAREATGEERERLWQRDVEIYPGRTVYERRATHRRIPVVVLAPVNDEVH